MSISNETETGDLVGKEIIHDEYTPHYVTFCDDYDGSVDPNQVFEARVHQGERKNCSDLYLNGVLVHSDVPDELIQEFEGNYILELGRDVKVAIDPERKRMVTLVAGTQLLKVAAREAFPNFLCQADPAWPTFWLGKNSADKHYRSTKAERNIVVKQR